MSDELAPRRSKLGGDLDPHEWRAAFESSDPHDALRTMAVTGSHSAIVNAYVEVLKASACSRLLGLLPHRRPRAEPVFEAVRSDGGITKEQAELLSSLYVLEGRVEHASPDVDPEGSPRSRRTSQQGPARPD